MAGSGSGGATDAQMLGTSDSPTGGRHVDVSPGLFRSLLVVLKHITCTESTGQATVVVLEVVVDAPTQQ